MGILNQIILRNIRLLNKPICFPFFNGSFSSQLYPSPQKYTFFLDPHTYIVFSIFQPIFLGFLQFSSIEIKDGLLYMIIRFIIHFKMADHINLNEEVQQQKYESYSNVKTGEFNTLQEPVIQTIKRDVQMIGEKIKTTLSGEGDYKKLQRQWDLWGPLVISLVTAGLAALSTKGGSDQAFTSIFIGLWIGPLMITLNSRLLGSKIPIIQTLCLILYCSSPIMFLSFLVFIMNLIIRSFFINLMLGVFALLFTLRCNLNYFKTLNSAQKQLLSLYPVLLFYTFICLFISMI